MFQKSGGTMSNQALVVFTPSGRRGKFDIGTSVLQAARSLGVDIDSVCGGRAICGRCQVLLSEGSFPKHGVESSAENLSPLSENEHRFDSEQGLTPGRRLSCSVQIRGDVVIDVPAESQVHRQVVRKRVEVHDINLDPAIRLHFVEVPEPSMHEPTGDLERLKDALEFEWGLTGLRVEPAVLSSLQVALRDGQWKATVAVRNEQQIVAVWPGYVDAVYGLAVDVGSTTIAVNLVNLATGDVLASSGAMNPQIRFGEDLMSRVSYVMMNPGGETEMTDVVREAIAKLAEDVAGEAGISTDYILEVVLVGNPIMHHLLLGINPVELGGAPFALATDSAVEMSARDLNLRLHAEAVAYVLPCIAGHVGADTAGVLLSEGPWLRDEITLIVDVGTNAEIVLGNRHRMLAASSPTGPAFEGAQISGGQRAAPGAIERVRIDPETLEPKYRIIGSQLWSNDENFSADIVETGITGICGSGIIEVVAEMYLAGIITSDGVVRGELSEKTDRIEQDGRTFSYRCQSGPVCWRSPTNGPYEYRQRRPDSSRWRFR